MAGSLELYNDPFEGDFLPRAFEMAAKISKTAFVPDAFRNKPEEVLAAILAGRELGIGPMRALQAINVIKGKPTQSAELMRSLVQAHGHEIWTEDYTQSRVTLCGRRKGEDTVEKVVWTLDDAKRAGLAGKENWRQYPRAMLLARATGELCRLKFADVLAGIAYTPEELNDGVLDVELTSPPAALETGDDGGDDGEPRAITRKAAAPRKAAAKRADPPPRAAAPPPPPLPGEEDDGEPDAESVERARQIGMKASQAGLSDEERHALIGAVTNGRVESGKLVTVEEAGDVLRAIHDIANGRKTLTDGRLVDVEDASGDEPDAPAEPEVPAGDEDQWDRSQWKAFLKANGVTEADFMRQVRLEAEGFGEEQPVGLDALKGRTRLCQLGRGWVEELVEARA